MLSVSEPDVDIRLAEDHQLASDLSVAKLGTVMQGSVSVHVLCLRQFRMLGLASSNRSEGYFHDTGTRPIF